MLLEFPRATKILKKRDDGTLGNSMVPASDHQDMGLRVMLLFVIGSLVFIACGGSDIDLASLSPQEREGFELVDEKGCAACHGATGQGGLGPRWTTTSGTTIELVGGGTTIADTEYLRRSIADPGADLVAGYNIAMPKAELTNDEIDAIVAFIERD